MTKREIKLPALTRAEIEALPNDTYIDAYGERLLKRKDKDGEAHFHYFSPRLKFSVDTIRRRGGITARLVDPAPLEALLRVAQCPACDGSGSYPDPSDGSQVQCQWCYEREAALNPEQNDV